jgi:hypothetical protein
MAAALERHDTAQAPKKVTQVYGDIRAWLASPETPFTRRFGYVPYFPHRLSLSPALESGVPHEAGRIVLIQQFYVAADPVRHAENVACLRFNLQNKAIDEIVLLNEREYTPKELGTEREIGSGSPTKLRQVVIGRRLTYTQAFEYARSLDDQVFVVLANADIFFDASVRKVRESGLKAQKRVLCQLRHEYDGRTDLRQCVPFGVEAGFAARPDSQDAWIWYSGHDLRPELGDMFDMALGTPGCDNHVMHCFGMAGFERLNVPSWVKVYHYHPSALRDHHKNLVPRCHRPYHMLYPFYPTGAGPHPSASFDIVRSNAYVRELLREALASGSPFILPRVAGIENDVAALGAELEQAGHLPQDRAEALSKGLPRVQRHAGVRLIGDDQVMHYARTYLAAFHAATAYFSWAPGGNVARHYALSFTFVETNFTQPRIDAHVLDIFDTVCCDPWTRALRGKRLLIVSAFADTMRSQVALNVRPYPVELFPECTFTFLKPPQTQGGNPGRPFGQEMEALVGRVRAVKDTFDVALCACGGYGNPLCAAIYNMGKSAIYVGGVLQMYFGVYGARWERETPEALSAYKHAGWVRPAPSERPAGREQIEDSCYW